MQQAVTILSCLNAVHRPSAGSLRLQDEIAMCLESKRIQVVADGIEGHRERYEGRLGRNQVPLVPAQL
jgi:hypothetical protein